MVKVALSCDGDYSVIAASNLETPYQILTYQHINPATRKVFINGQALKAEQFDAPISGFTSPGVTVHITVKF